MTNDEILEKSKKKFADGANYIDISIFLKESGVDEAMRKIVFYELDRIKKSKTTNKVEISIGKLILGLTLTAFGTYFIYTGQFSWKSLLILVLFVIVGGIILLVEIAKMINNILRR